MIEEKDEREEHLTARQLADAMNIDVRRIYSYARQGLIVPDIAPADSEYNLGQINYLIDLRKGAPIESSAGKRVEGESDLPTWAGTLRYIRKEPGSKTIMASLLEAKNDKWVKGVKGAARALNVDPDTFQGYEYRFPDLIERRGGEMLFSNETAAAFIRYFRAHEQGVNDKELANMVDLTVSREWIRQRREKIPHTKFGRQVRFDPATAIPKIHELRGVSA